jgi:hypothetical protein
LKNGTEPPAFRGRGSKEPGKGDVKTLAGLDSHHFF